jgi:hypothetical protein
VEGGRRGVRPRPSRPGQAGRTPRAGGPVIPRDGRVGRVGRAPGARADDDPRAFRIEQGQLPGADTTSSLRSFEVLRVQLTGNFLGAKPPEAIPQDFRIDGSQLILRTTLAFVRRQARVHSTPGKLRFNWTLSPPPFILCLSSGL